MNKAHRYKANTYVRSYLLEAMAEADFKPSEFKVLIWLIRNTYGFRVKKGGPQRDRVRVSYETIAEKTKQTEKTVCRAINRLQKLNVVFVYEAPISRTGTPGVFGINSDDDTWVLSARSRTQSEPGFECAITHAKEALSAQSRTQKEAVLSACSRTQTDKPRTQSGQTAHSKTQKFPTTTTIAADGLRSKDNVVKITEGESPPEEGVSNTLTAVSIHCAIGRRYFPMTGPPYTEMATCQKYVDLCADDPELGKEALNEAFRRVFAWEEKAGRKINKPFSVLNDAAHLFQHGWEPEGDERPEYYDWRKDPDLAWHDEE